MTRLLGLIFLSLGLFACEPFDLLFGSNQTPSKQSDNEEHKQNEENKIRKKCGTLNVVYKAFQDYIICLEKIPTDTLLYYGHYAEFYIIKSVSGTRKDDLNIQVACANVFNQVYQSIPDTEKRDTGGILSFYDMDYFHDLYIFLKQTPVEGNFKYISRGALLGIGLLKDTKAQSCFQKKFEEYRKEGKGFKWPRSRKDVQGAQKIFLKDCRKQEGEKAYQNLNQQFGCDTI